MMTNQHGTSQGTAEANMEVDDDENVMDDDDNRVNDTSRHMNDSTLPPRTVQAMMAHTFRSSTSSSGSSTATAITTNTSNAASNAASNATATATTTTTIRKLPNPRTNKKSLFGLGDWTRLVKSSKDLAQRKGHDLRRSISKEEVAQHKYEYDAWIILHNRVYNIGPYLPYHPGGLSILKPYLGKDATAAFEKYHRWVNADGLIGTLLLGYLDLTPRSTQDETTVSYLPHGTTTTTPAHEIRTDDAFAVPAPRQPSHTNTTSNSTRLPSLLLETLSMEEDEEV